jgi:hypothetical protein
MKNKILKLIVASIFVTTGLLAQENQEVQLVVNGQGKDIELAKANALRSAIEQAYGVFISSKTEIFNDELVKDEIIAVANGNIRDYQVLSEIQLTPELYSATLKATVSIGNLKNFCESKGMTSEFSGSLFGANIKMQRLYEANEALAIKELCEAMKPLALKAFDYNLQPSEPKNSDADKWTIEFAVEVAANANLTEIETYLTNSLQGLSLSESEKENYIKLNKKVYPVKIGNESVFLRNIHSLAFIQDLAWYIHFTQVNFMINDGFKDISPYDVSLGKLAPNQLRDGYVFSYGREWESNWGFITNQNYDYPSIPINPFGDFRRDKISFDDRMSYAPTYSFVKNEVKKIYTKIIKEITFDAMRESVDKNEVLKIQDGRIKELNKHFPDSSTAYLGKIPECCGMGTYLKPMPYNQEYYLVLDFKRRNLDIKSYGAMRLWVVYSEQDLEKIRSFSIKTSPKKTEEW